MMKRCLSTTASKSLQRLSSSSSSLTLPCATTTYNPLQAASSIKNNKIQNRSIMTHSSSFSSFFSWKTTTSPLGNFLLHKNNNDDDDNDEDNNNNIQRVNNKIPLHSSSHLHHHHHHHHPHNNTSSSLRRSFHSTPKREIIPLVALLVGGITIRYTYKALQRMDVEWEEYEEQLREYKLERGLDPDAPLPQEEEDGSETGSMRKKRAAAAFKGGVLAIDLGTVNIRIAHHSNDSKQDKDKKPSLVVDREGGRSTPNSILLSAEEEDDDDDHNNNTVIGRLAHAKLHQVDNVYNPHFLLQQQTKEEEEKEKKDDDNNQKMMEKAVKSVIYSAAKNALEQTLGGSSSSTSGGSTNNKPLFAIDASSSSPGTFEAQPIYTYPPPPSSPSSSSSSYLEKYKEAVASLSSPPHISSFISEPIAALKGAQLYNLLPSSSSATTTTTLSNNSILIIDVGGNSTSISLVNPKSDTITHSTTIPYFGGQTLIEALVTNLIKSFYSSSRYSFVKDLNDSMAKQRLYDASSAAVMELSTKTRAEIDIPYLTVDEKMRPRHLKMGVSRNVLEAEMNGILQTSLQQKEKEEQKKLLLSSSSFPSSPTDLPSLFSSVLMKLLEESKMNPFEIQNVLVVGGGARSPIVVSGIKKGVGALVGEQFVEERVVVPEGELVEELVVLGAAASADSRSG